MKIQGHEILFRTIIGSQAYGTNIEGSDVDYKGVFIQDVKDKYLNGYRDEIKVSKDEVYFEFEKFLSLCSTGNPTMLELLYSPEHCIVHITDVFKDIINMRDIFLTKNLRHSFANYAYQQIKKSDGLDKMMNWEKDKTIRKSVVDMCRIYPLEENRGLKGKLIDFIDIKLGQKNPIEKAFRTKAISVADWCNMYNDTIGYRDHTYCGLVKIEHFRDCYLMFYHHQPWISNYKGISSDHKNGYKPIANDVCLSEVSKYEKPVGILFFHKDAYSTHCKDYKNYEEWLEKRNTQRYVDVEGHGQKIDGKNILHCVRIVETAMEIPTQKTINIFRPNREYLIEIRKGKYDLATLQAKAEEDILIMDKLFRDSDLPDKFKHQNVIDSFIMDVRKFYYEDTIRN